MKTISLGELLSDEQLQECVRIHREGVDVHHRLFVLIQKAIPDINRKTGQENDPRYWAFAVEYALDTDAGRIP
jgi:hypothetical protein